MVVMDLFRPGLVSARMGNISYIRLKMKALINLPKGFTFGARGMLL